MKKVAVYCGASTGNKPMYEAATVELAHWLVAHDLELVYGGGGVGLMGVLANTVISDGGQVHGIIPQDLYDRGTALKTLTDLRVVADMDVRKATMMKEADACVALPGGPGTLEEIAEAYSWARIGDNDDPCVFFNVNGYYDPLRQMFDRMTEEAFLTEPDRQKLLFSDSLSDVWTFINSYVPPVIRTY
ncbi:MAG TPA: TIGR00730 family Rossman fold protein [Lactobacillus sp.]|nr:TIGR00730 family Rossman fold protein [Lactobacillus sp.]